MITIIILIIIYIAFISLGLPDSILGAALPSMIRELGVDLSAGGLVSSISIGCAIVSSFLSGHVIKKLGTGITVLFSCVLTGGALLGYSLAPSFFWYILLSVPLGLGGGAVDTALNNYIALHYKAHHMNWLHSFWGVGATLGPVIMSRALAVHGSWRIGYRNISLIQLSLALVFLVSLPLWKRARRIQTAHNDVKNNESHQEGVLTAQGNSAGQNGTSTIAEKPNIPIRKLQGVTSVFIIMMIYCTIESAIGLWGSSYLVAIRNYGVESAASVIAFYFGGIMAGRFLSGFLSFKFSNRQLIISGSLFVLFGTILLALFSNPVMTAISVVSIGIGLAPIFPSMLHDTPNRFGREKSQILIGYQMGTGYIGSAVLSPVIGVILQYTEIAVFPYIVLGLAILMLGLYGTLPKWSETTDRKSVGTDLV